ncbi:hypothetical protein [Halosimplex halobium]|uniref:hypothetical protein n=1 Tax=Halosimplex halobium TaxID=3396618 RepID=UPI003F564414
MFGSGMERFQQLRQVAQDPTESELVQALVEILVALEFRQLRAVKGLHDSLDIDGVQINADEEEREQQLLDLVDAIASREFKRWWFTDVVGGKLDNADDAMAYAGLDEGKWEEQKQTWADTWRERGGESFSEHTDEDLARLHVERKFGVSLREFEREVIEWSRKDAMRTILAGNFEAVEDGINAATATVEGGDSA